MSNITDWIKYDLYPTLFESIDKALPELNFRRYGSKWSSSLKRDGSKPKTPTPDKTIVSSKAPGLILENGDKAQTLVDYVMYRDNVTFLEAVKTLAEVVNLELPKGDIDQDSYISYKERATILEDCNSYFIYCLENAPGAKDIREYLDSRGYSAQDIKAMELGYIPSQTKLYTYLQKQKYSQALIDEIKLHKSIGEENSLSIPFRSNGSLKGFIFRTITPGQANKYLNSTGLVRSETLFNIKPAKGDKDIVIVEGYLDALISEARGVENIVGLGGVNLSTEQIKHAISKGAKKFTLCLDNDKAGVEATLRAIELILAEGVNRVYIVNLPTIEGIKTDPDSLIKERGVEAFKQAIAEALPYYEYKLQATLQKYGQIEEERGLQPKDIDNLLDEVVETATNIQEATDKERYKTLFTSLEAIQALGITQESLSITVDRITTTREKEAQAKELKQLLTDATKLHTEGKVEEALGKLEAKVKDVKLQDKKTEFSKLLTTTSEKAIREEELLLPDSLDTGYIIGGNELLLPGGAISVIAAPTNHGKTIALINIVLNVAEKNPDKRFIFFTYEERANSIIQYFLNAYINENLNNSDRANRRLIKEYFKTGSTQYFSHYLIREFEEKKATFFKTYIETGRILVKYVDYNSSELTGAIQYLHKEAGNIGGVFIDYFQLLKLPQDKYRNYSSRVEELKQICISIKDVAVTTGLPLVLAAQFNREVTNLMRLHPTNIGEAGDIERIVNTLIGLWNMYKKPVLKGITDAESTEINNRTAGVEKGMYLEILKSRDLPTGAYEVLDFNGNTGKIENNSNPERQNNIFK